VIYSSNGKTMHYILYDIQITSHEMAIVYECLVFIGTRYCFTPLNGWLMRVGDDEYPRGRVLDSLMRIMGEDDVGFERCLQLLARSRWVPRWVNTARVHMIILGFAHWFDRMIINVVYLLVGWWVGGLSV